MIAIRTENLTKTFGTNRAVDGLDLEIMTGEIFGLVGPDGAGKTTAMRLLTGIMESTEGNGWVLGRHIKREAEAIKDDIGYMSQRFGLYPDLSVLENIHFYADLYGEPRQGRDAKIDKLLAFSNLTPFKKRLADNLSGGMKQKLGLACALIHTPKVLFLDEPTNGVDPVSRRDFWRILYQLLAEKVTIFVSTAYLDEAERCNRIGLMHEGRILNVGTPTEIKEMMTGSLLEVRCRDARQATKILRHQFGVDAVGLFGDRVHVVTNNQDIDQVQIVETLEKSGLGPSTVRPIVPSLEDVFVSALTAEKGVERHESPH